MLVGKLLKKENVRVKLKIPRTNRNIIIGSTFYKFKFSVKTYYTI